jgi:hypothetical protein
MVISNREKKFMSQQRLLSKLEIEKLLMREADALHVNITLDKIDDLPGRRGYSIRSHDSYGPLPDIEVEYLDVVEYVVDRIDLALEMLCPNLGC